MNILQTGSAILQSVSGWQLGVLGEPVHSPDSLASTVNSLKSDCQTTFYLMVIQRWYHSEEICFEFWSLLFPGWQAADCCFSLGPQQPQVIAPSQPRGLKPSVVCCAELGALCIKCAFHPWCFKLMMVDEIWAPSNSGSICVFVLLLLVLKD